MRVAVAMATLWLFVGTGACLAQMSTDEALRGLHDRLAQEKPAKQQEDAASTQPSNLTNGQVAKLYTTIEAQKHQIDDLTLQVAQLKDKLAFSELNLRNAQATIATANGQAAAGAQGAAPPALDINTAMAQHTLTAGMTVDQCKQSLHGGNGPLNASFFWADQTYSDPNGEEKYRFDVAYAVDQRTSEVYFRPYLATFENGKLSDWHTGESETAIMGSHP